MDPSDRSGFLHNTGETQPHMHTYQRFTTYQCSLGLITYLPKDSFLYVLLI